jgi:hypothetical protein
VLTREVENTDFRVDGRLVTVEGRIPLGEGIQPSAVDPPYPPQVTWGYTRGSDGGTVTLRHEAGESVPSDALGLEFDVDDTGQRWSNPAGRPLPTERERLGPGGAVTVDVGDVPAVTVIHPDQIDHGADDPYADGESRRATRLDLEFGTGSSDRTLFVVPLGVDR